MKQQPCLKSLTIPISQCLKRTKKNWSKSRKDNLTLSTHNGWALGGKDSIVLAVFKNGGGAPSDLTYFFGGKMNRDFTDEMRGRREDVFARDIRAVRQREGKSQR